VVESIAVEELVVTIQDLRACEVFSGLSDEELVQILPLCEERSYAKGSRVFDEGDVADTFYILQEGQVRLEYEICPQPDYCQDATILLDRPGDFMGWSSLVKPRRLTAYGVCVTDIRVVTIDSRRLNELMERDSHIGFVVVKELAGLINNRLKEAKGLTLRRIMGSL
jgi:CRP/FNR family transcriptional regulator, cyclic AMP receptor protein